MRFQVITCRYRAPSVPISTESKRISKTIKKTLIVVKRKKSRIQELMKMKKKSEKLAKKEAKNLKRREANKVKRRLWKDE